MRTKLRGRPTIRKEQGKKTVQRERERERLELEEKYGMKVKEIHKIKRVISTKQNEAPKPSIIFSIKNSLFNGI